MTEPLAVNEGTKSCRHQWEPAGKREIRGAKTPKEVCRKCGAVREAKA